MQVMRCKAAISAAIGAALLLAACSDDADISASGAAGETVGDTVGGIEPVATDHEMVREAARFAAAALGRNGADLARVTHAEWQVVAGFNYYLDIELTDGSRWTVVVWDNPEGTMELTEARQR